ncbi:hypothetical protein VNI00_003340 [Paramarasmius palmivorus]|uniref:Uncharacterized protein n=1 Tax=Paramarasmius palmivorus TaxID=297713 RepID=A0AAW0DT17_9AGAR
MPPTTRSRSKSQSAPPSDRTSLPTRSHSQPLSPHTKRKKVFEPPAQLPAVVEETASSPLTSTPPSPLLPASINPASIDPASINPASINPASKNPASINPVITVVPATTQSSGLPGSPPPGTETSHAEDITANGLNPHAPVNFPDTSISNDPTPVNQSPPDHHLVTPAKIQEPLLADSAPEPDEEIATSSDTRAQISQSAVSNTDIHSPPGDQDISASHLKLGGASDTAVQDIRASDSTLGDASDTAAQNCQPADTTDTTSLPPPGNFYDDLLEPYNTSPLFTDDWFGETNTFNTFSEHEPASYEGLVPTSDTPDPSGSGNVVSTSTARHASAPLDMTETPDTAKMYPFLTDEAERQREHQQNVAAYNTEAKSLEVLGRLSQWDEKTQSVVPYYLPARLVGNLVVPVPDKDLQAYIIHHRCEPRCRCGHCIKIITPADLNPDRDNPVMYVMVCGAQPGEDHCNYRTLVTRFRHSNPDQPIYQLQNPKNILYLAYDKQRLSDAEATALGFDMTRPSFAEPSNKTTTTKSASPSSTSPVKRTAIPVELLPRDYDPTLYDPIITKPDASLPPAWTSHRSEHLRSRATQQQNISTPAPPLSQRLSDQSKQTPPKKIVPTIPDGPTPERLPERTIFTPTPPKKTASSIRDGPTPERLPERTIFTPTPPQSRLSSSSSQKSRRTSHKSQKAAVETLFTPTRTASDHNASDEDSDVSDEHTSPVKPRTARKGYNIVQSDDEYQPPIPNLKRKQPPTDDSDTGEPEVETVSPIRRVKKARPASSSGDVKPTAKASRSNKRISDANPTKSKPRKKRLPKARPFPDLAPLDSSPLPPPSQVMQARSPSPMPIIKLEKEDPVNLSQTKPKPKPLPCPARASSPTGSIISISSDEEPPLKLPRTTVFGRTKSTAFDLTNDTSTAPSASYIQVMSQMVRPDKGKGKATDYSDVTQPTFHRIPLPIFLASDTLQLGKSASTKSASTNSGPSNKPGTSKRKPQWVDPNPPPIERKLRLDDPDADVTYWHPKKSHFVLMLPTGHERPITAEKVEAMLEDAVKLIRPSAARCGITLDQMRQFMGLFSLCDRCELVYFMGGGLIHKCEGV